jgi:hypothetical protein
MSSRREREESRKHCNKIETLRESGERLHRLPLLSSNPKRPTTSWVVKTKKRKRKERVEPQLANTSQNNRVKYK